MPVESLGKLHYRAAGDSADFDVEHIPMMVADGAGMVWAWASIRGEGERVVRDDRMLGNCIGPGESDYTRYDEAVAARAERWLAERADAGRPWCPFLGFVNLHFPLVVPQPWFDLYQPEWKYIHYIGFEPELFDLEANREETTSLAADPTFPEFAESFDRRLRGVCNPEATDAQAHTDQAAMIEAYGGREAALRLGAPGATPAPEIPV